MESHVSNHGYVRAGAQGFTCPRRLIGVPPGAASWKHDPDSSIEGSSGRARGGSMTNREDTP